MTSSVCAIIMASGHSRRFGSDKLWYPVDGIPMIRRVMETCKGVFRSVIVVTRDERILQLSEEFGYCGVKNPDLTDDTAITIALGLEHLPKDCTAAALVVADQPYLSKSSLFRMIDLSQSNPQGIIRLFHGQTPGNPVLFPRQYFDELLNLQPGQRGRDVILRHRDKVVKCPVDDAKELVDLDVPPCLS